jgi:hypothetical protein
MVQLSLDSLEEKEEEGLKKKGKGILRNETHLSFSSSLKE